jgi:hypothetical protein
VTVRRPRCQGGSQRPVAPNLSGFGPGVESELEMVLANRLQHAGLPMGVTQHRFVPGRQFRWDRCWPDRLVAVECQGAVWANGAHSRGSGVQRDCLKFSLGAALGWRVLPITREMIESGEAVELIRQALAHDGREV